MIPIPCPDCMCMYVCIMYVFMYVHMQLLQLVTTSQLLFSFPGKEHPRENRPGEFRVLLRHAGPDCSKLRYGIWQVRCEASGTQKAKCEALRPR